MTLEQRLGVLEFARIHEGEAAFDVEHDGRLVEEAWGQGDLAAQLNREIGVVRILHPDHHHRENCALNQARRTIATRHFGV